ncbi:MAG: UDP-2,3-diacylglucosamine diphosphatase LpxI [Deltaproteobacteria bacterium]|nr:UDP-2,3-diacylglucosamine diphosphatase LpxI [Deltaproteobacteria bacterium]
MSLKKPVGLIAGNLKLPILTAQKLRHEGSSIVVVGLKGETEPQIKELADFYLELPLGQLRPMADFFREHGAQKICMVGGVSRETVTSGYEPDEAAFSIMEKLDNFQTDAILRAVAEWLEEQGLYLVSVAEICPDLLVKPGLLTQTAPSPALLEDLRLAFKVAKELGRLDVGQTVVVSDKITVALEGADGTDATIRRGAALSRKPIAVAKVFKPKQDNRLDLPVIGLETIAVLVECRAAGLALDAKGVIMLDPKDCLDLANQNALAIVALEELPSIADGQR